MVRNKLMYIYICLLQDDKLIIADHERYCYDLETEYAQMFSPNNGRTTAATTATTATTTPATTTATAITISVTSPLTPLSPNKARFYRRGNDSPSRSRIAATTSALATATFTKL